MTSLAVKLFNASPLPTDTPMLLGNSIGSGRNRALDLLN